uniref:Multifunctional fusion protein n=3 Tax=Arthropoda TaxID=6656 RepID=A0AAN0LJ60_9ACAR
MSISSSNQCSPLFRPFTRASLTRIQKKITMDQTRKRSEIEQVRHHHVEEKKPIASLEQSLPLPKHYKKIFPPELIATPIEDIDPYYKEIGQTTFMVVSKGRDIFRFSASKSLFLLDPFNPIRRVAIYMLVHPWFNFLVIVTILVNCILMTMKSNETIESTEIIFTTIYTFESCLKVTARGFIFSNFTYLRDPWNWLDFVVIGFAYLTMIFTDLGKLSALRTFRVLRALKTVAIVPGMKTIVGAVIESVKNLKDVIILTCFSLSVFALLGLQIYMGVLTQKCILIPPKNLTDAQWEAWNQDSKHWIKDYTDNYMLCSNSSYGQTCNTNISVCLSGYGSNPDYNYTNFDNFGWALLCAFRLMTQDFWESLYQMVLRTTSPWHLLFFMAAIFLGSIYLVNLILAIVAMSYDDLQKRASEEETAAAEEEAAYQEQNRLNEEEMSNNNQNQPGYLNKINLQRRKSRRTSSIQTMSDISSSITPNESIFAQNYLNDRQIEVITKQPKSRNSSINYLVNLPQQNFDIHSYQSQLPQLEELTSSISENESIELTNNLKISTSSEKYKLLNTSIISFHHNQNTDIHQSSNLDTNNCDNEKISLIGQPSNLEFIIPNVDSENSYFSHSNRLSFSSENDFIKNNWLNENNKTEKDSFCKSDMNDHLSKNQLLNNKIENTFSLYDSNSGNAKIDLKDQISPYDNEKLNNSVPLFDNKNFDNLHIPSENVLLNEDLLDDELLMLMEEEQITLKQQLGSCCLHTVDILCVWDCCWCWVRVQELFALLVFDPFMELFITLCIVINTMFMAMDHDDMDPDFNSVLKNGNLFFTSAFAIEAIMKLVALSPKFYFREGWNIFDFIIVALSLLELGLDGVQGLSVLRSFRLLRVFKLAKSWPTLNLLISIMGKTVGDLGNLTFVLGIIIFIFAVMGMQMFGGNYEKHKDRFPDGTVPRWNFSDFLHSFMIVFRVLCGEWIQSMWDCMLVSGWPCIPFFLGTVVIGYLVVLNLFLALLLSSFGASNLSAPTSDSADTKKLQEAFERFSRANKWIRNKIFAFLKLIKSKTTNQITKTLHKLNRSKELDNRSSENMANNISIDKTCVNKKIRLNFSNLNNKTNFTNNFEKKLNNTFESNSYFEDDNESVDSIDSQIDKINVYKENVNQEEYTQNMKLLDQRSNKKLNLDSNSEICKINNIANNSFLEEESTNDKLETVTADIIISEYPVDCFPETWYEKFDCCMKDTSFWQKWRNIRCKSYIMVEHKYFETLVITLILLSSMTLALEDVHLRERKWLQEILSYVDQFFTIIFFLEMLLKWVAYGFRSYFSNAWCWLDFVIVMVSCINLTVGMMGFNNIPAFKTMRTLRALRPLRALSRLEGMKVSVLNIGASFLNMAKIQAFKTMRTLRALRPLRAMSRMQGMRVVVNALVQAIPSIFNVLLVCLIFWLIFAIMGVQLFVGKFAYCEDPETNHIVDYTIVTNKSDCAAYNMTWTNPMINFDNVLNGYLSLFQVATFKGWIEIMYHAIDSKEKDQQPQSDVNIYMYLYFVFFIIFGSFFTLNLFIGVIIDNFNEQKKKAGGSLEMFMTEDQKKYYNAMKKMSTKKPIKAIPRPRIKIQAVIFDITTNKKFDMIIMLFILMNMVIMALDQFKASEQYNRILESFNLFFIAVFTAECLLKLFALRLYYFKEPWNLFDFVVVILSIIGTILREWMLRVSISPTLLRVVRVVKIGRVLRLVKGARGIRTLLFALAMSLPALFNICLLLFLVMFIYAIFGMSFFMNVKKRYGIDDTFNFGTFFKSFILLFQMCTSAGWDGVLAAIMDDNNCYTDEEMAKLVGDDNLPGNCGNKGIAIAYLISYLIISFLVIINMYIAVILENYSQAKEDVQEGLTDEDYDMFYEIWQKYDPKGTQFIHSSLLSDFLDDLEEPLQIPKPNKYKIVSMDIPICKNDLCYCVEVLDALTKDFFFRKGHVIDEQADIPEILPTKDKFEHISSTLWRQREDYCAIVIQQFYRNYVRKKYLKTDSNESKIVPFQQNHVDLLEEVKIITDNCFLTSFKYGLGKTIAGAIPLAVDYVNENPDILPNHTMNFITADTQKPYSADGLKVMTYFKEQGVVAFIGPEETCISEALLSTAYNLPMIAYKCADRQVSNKEIYRTFSRTLPPSSKISKSLISLLKHFDWKKVVLVINNNPTSQQIKEAFVDLAQNHSIQITQTFYINSPYYSRNNHTIKTIIEKSCHLTRIYVLITESHAAGHFAKFLYEKQKNIFHEYTLISIEDEEAFNPWKKQQYFNSFLNEELNNDLNFTQIRYPFKIMLMLTPSPPTNPNYKTFCDHVLYNAQIPPFKVPLHPKIKPHVPSYAGLAYDAVIIYAKALTKVLEKGGKPTDGDKIMNYIINQSYESILGFTDRIDSNGDAEGNYTLLAFKDDGGMLVHNDNLVYVTLPRMIPVGKFKKVKNSDLPQLFIDREIVWLNGEKPPKDETECGFDNENCKFKPSFLLILICSVMFLIFIVSMVLILRRFRYEQKLESEFWRVDFQEVMVLNLTKKQAFQDVRNAISKFKNESSQFGINVQLNNKFLEGKNGIGFYRGNVVFISKVHKRNVDLTRSVCKELIQLHEMRNENINPFIGVSLEPNNICIFKMYCMRGSLEDILRNEDLNMDTMFIASLVADLIKGLIYLHYTENIAHGDLKSSNCLVDSRWVLQITGFGLDKFRSGEEIVGTKLKKRKTGLLWKSPEVLRKINFEIAENNFNTNLILKTQNLTMKKKADIYSFGIILYEVIGRKGPWGDIINPKELFIDNSFFKNSNYYLNKKKRSLLTTSLVDNKVFFNEEPFIHRSFSDTFSHNHRNSNLELDMNSQSKIENNENAEVSSVCLGLEFNKDSNKEFLKPSNLLPLEINLDPTKVINFSIESSFKHGLKTSSVIPIESPVYFRKNFENSKLSLFSEKNFDLDFNSYQKKKVKAASRKNSEKKTNKNKLSIDDIVDRVKNPENYSNNIFRPDIFALKNCPQYLANCIQLCWNEKPETRPDIKQINNMLAQLQSGLKSNIFDNMIAIMEKHANNLEILVENRTKELLEEKKKTENLLFRMLPKPVAEQLKKGQNVKAEQFDCVTIYFSDIVGFTELAAISTPLQVVTLLNDLYTCFDSIIGNYEVYKVETIGDAYMVVSGLISNSKNCEDISKWNHSVEIAFMALHLKEKIYDFKIKHRPGEQLKLRIGLHSGPVVAGVVGLKMPRYCLFGDTVNVASRMESNSLPLKIHLSENCKKNLDKHGGFLIQERGMTFIKGKGEMRTYWLTGTKNKELSLSNSFKQKKKP